MNIKDKLPEIGIAVGIVGMALVLFGGCEARAKFESKPAPPKLNVIAPATNPTEQDLARLDDKLRSMVSEAFEIGMSTGYLFAQRGGTTEQLKIAMAVAVTNRGAIVQGTLSGSLWAYTKSITHVTNDPNSAQP